MSTLKRCLLGFALAFMALCLVAAASLYSAATWLLDSQSPDSADAIVVLAGDIRRVRYAGDLYRRGLAPQILLSRPARDARERMLDQMGIAFPTADDLGKAVLRASGVPLQKILVFGSGSMSTFEEATALARMFSAGSPRLLVVTSPYHVRRARLILGHALPGASLIVVATPYEDFPAHWWTSQDAARDLLLEVAKLTFYFIGGRFTAVRP